MVLGPTSDYGNFNYKLTNKYVWNININYNITDSKCNSINNPNQIFNCQNIKINFIRAKKFKPIFSYIHPRCGEALELYCPNNNHNIKYCLNCIIKNEFNLSSCSLKEKENWCN